MNNIIQELYDGAEYQANKLKLLNIDSNKNFVLITGKIDLPVYFAFYKRYIVCSGDFGEWQFHCTWNTVKDGKPMILGDEDYLISKVSRDCKYEDFDSELFRENLLEWFNDLDSKDEDNDLIKDECKKDFTNQDLKQMIEYLSVDGNEYFYLRDFEDFRDDFNDISNVELDYETISDMGYKPNAQFLINVKMLMKIRDYFERKEE